MMNRPLRDFPLLVSLFLLVMSSTNFDGAQVISGAMAAESPSPSSSSAAVAMVLRFLNSSTPSRPFSSQAKVAIIRDHYAAAAGDSEALKVVRRRTGTEPTDFSQVHLIVRVRGDLAAPLLADAAAPMAQFLVDVGLVSAERYIRAPAAPSAMAGSPVLFSIAASEGVVLPFTIDSVSWAIAGIAVFVLLPVAEAMISACCYNCGSKGGLDEHDVHPDAHEDYDY